MSPSTSSSSSSFLQVVSGVVLGSIAGATMTYYYLTQSKNDDNHNNNRDRGGILSRSVVPVYGGSTTTTTTSHHHAKKFDDVTHVNFLSDVIARLWPYLCRAGATIIQESMEPTFRDTMPGPLTTLHFTDIDLGNSPIIIDNIIVHEEKKKNSGDGSSSSIQFDWDITWDTKCNIQLEADTGVVGTKIRFGIQSIEFRGRMSFVLKPLSSDVIPCFDAITYSFINPPTVEIDFTGLANVADWSIVENTIRQTINDTIASMVVLPVRMMTKMVPTSHLFDIYTPLKGIARVTIMNGRGFVEEQRSLRSPDIPDVYVTLSLGATTSTSSSQYKSPTIHNELNPNWMEHSVGDDGRITNYDHVCDFVVSDLDQLLFIEAWDEDSGTIDSDDFLGSTKVTITQLLLAGGTMELELWTKPPKKGTSKPTGAFVTIDVDLLPLTTTQRLDRTTIVEAPVSPTNQLVGVVAVLISQAFNLPVPKDDAESFVKVWYGDKEIGVTSIVTPIPGYDALNPLYDVPFHILLTPSNYERSEIKLQLINKDVIIGELVIGLDELRETKDGTIREKKKSIGTEGASLEFSISLFGTASSSSMPPGTSPPTGSNKVELTIVKGFGFQPKKKRRFRKTDIPDVYCVAKFGSNQWRTKTIKNNTTPLWNESRSYHMTSPNNVISIDVYDENRRTKDDYYGCARISVGKVMIAGGTTDVEITADDGRTKTGQFITISAKYA